jgi:hypothetical protein
MKQVFEYRCPVCRETLCTRGYADRLRCPTCNPYDLADRLRQINAKLDARLEQDAPTEHHCPEPLPSAARYPYFVADFERDFAEYLARLKN